jgi:hypothetical protein
MNKSISMTRETEPYNLQKIDYEKFALWHRITIKNKCKPSDTNDHNAKSCMKHIIQSKHRIDHHYTIEVEGTFNDYSRRS